MDSHIALMNFTSALAKLHVALVAPDIALTVYGAMREPFWGPFRRVRQPPGAPAGGLRSAKVGE